MVAWALPEVCLFSREIASVVDQTLNALMIVWPDRSSWTSLVPYSFGEIITHEYGWSVVLFINTVFCGMSTVIWSPVINWPPDAILSPVVVWSDDTKTVGASNCQLFWETSREILHCAVSPTATYPPLIRSDFITAGFVVVGIIIVLHPIHSSQPVYSIVSWVINEWVVSANSAYIVFVPVVPTIAHEYCDWNVIQLEVLRSATVLANLILVALGQSIDTFTPVILVVTSSLFITKEHHVGIVVS